MGSPLEVTFQAQTFQSLGLSSRTDHGIFIDHTVVYPAIALDVCLCLDLHAKGINLDSFQSLGFSSGSDHFIIAHILGPANTLHMSTHKNDWFFDLDGLDLFALTFNASPFPVGCPCRPAVGLLMHTVPELLVPLDHKSLNTLTLSCSTNQSICIDIGILLVSIRFNVYGYIHPSIRLDPDCLNSPVLSGCPGHIPVAPPVHPADLPGVYLVCNRSALVLLYLCGASGSHITVRIRRGYFSVHDIRHREVFPRTGSCHYVTVSDNSADPIF